MAFWREQDNSNGCKTIGLRRPCLLSAFVFVLLSEHRNIHSHPLFDTSATFTGSPLPPGKDSIGKAQESIPICSVFSSLLARQLGGVHQWGPGGKGMRVAWRTQPALGRGAHLRAETQEMCPPTCCMLPERHAGNPTVEVCEKGGWVPLVGLLPFSWLNQSPGMANCTYSSPLVPTKVRHSCGHYLQSSRSHFYMEKIQRRAHAC